MNKKKRSGLFGPWFAQDENNFIPKMPYDIEIIDFSGAFGSINTARIPALPTFDGMSNWCW